MSSFQPPAIFAAHRQYDEISITVDASNPGFFYKTQSPVEVQRFQIGRVNVPEKLTHAELVERIVENHPKHILIDPTRFETSYVCTDAGPRVALIDQSAIQLAALGAGDAMITYGVEVYADGSGNGVCVLFVANDKLDHVSVKRFHAPHVVGAELSLV